MSRYQEEIEDALDAFVTVAALARHPVHRDELVVEILDAPHRRRALPRGRMAIYAFWWDGRWLKIGKAGPNSGARYLSQHYTGSAMSTLSGSLAVDPQVSHVDGFELSNAGPWIKASTCRVNILLASEHGGPLLSLLEAFLHARLQPKYEGG